MIGAAFQPGCDSRYVVSPSRLSRVAGGAAVIWGRIVVCALVALTTGAWSPATTAAGWSVQRTPTPVGATNGGLAGVSCASPTACIAVGGPLVERWDGTSWSVQSIPNPVGTTFSFLTAVSCSAPAACTAVGSYTSASGADMTLADRWDGTNWSIQPTPNPTDASYIILTGVSCASPTACMAIGSKDKGVGVQPTFVERWDGTSWSIQPTPGPAGATNINLTGVSCASPIACTAVGSYDKGTLVERWDGTSWSIQPTPGPAGGGELTGVSCASPIACTAVGSYDKGTLVERWDGTSWWIQPTPNPAGGGELTGVSCASPSACTAFGSYYSSAGHQRGLFERWDGTSWSIQPTPNPTGATDSSLSGASCASPSACTAVGSYSNPALGQDLQAADSEVLVERWNGAGWSVQSPPSANGALSGVSCASPTACTAVGSYVRASGRQVALVERWNGKRWSIQPTPNPTDMLFSRLQGVSCASPTTCSAVGSYDDSAGRLQGLAERWNGSRWSIQATLTPTGAGTPFSYLTSVSCSAPAACTAVGVSDDLPLAERWNGKRWTIQPTAKHVGPFVGTLHAVSCASPTACIAVGVQAASIECCEAPLIERWNGTSWSIRRPPPYVPGELDGVSCRSRSACTAVGISYGGPLAERWNGTSWSIQQSAAGISGRLSGVSCASPTACTAVGSYYDSAGRQRGLTERWNGRRWSIQPTPTPNDKQTISVSCPSRTACTAVGSRTSPSGVETTLAERWNG